MAQNSNENTRSSDIKFIDIAKTIPSELLESASSAKRIDSKTKLPSKIFRGFVQAIYMDVLIGNKKTALIEVTTNEGITVYVRLTDGGLRQPKNPGLMVGKYYAVVITNLIDLSDSGDNEERFCAIGSIQTAEYMIGYSLNARMAVNPKEFHDEKRIGTINSIVNTDINGRRHEMVFFEYSGLQLMMMDYQVGYYSQAHPLTSEYRLGDEVAFQIQNVELTRIDDAERGLRGSYFDIRASGKRFKENPKITVNRLVATGAFINAYITKVDPVKGVLVEVAPGYELKATFSNQTAGSNVKKLDAVEHTPVQVQVLSVDHTRRFGVVRVLSFPQGFADTSQVLF